jgi:protocatechuate 3,4-dioxygenase beta subunit
LLKGPVNCTLTPETDEGPYWVDERLQRSDIVEGQPGVPLALKLGVYRLDPSLAPFEGAHVDVWQANAHGLYSDEPDQPRANTGGENFLRGFQVTDEDGLVGFTAIYPSWYEGRTTHIHVRVRVFPDEGSTYVFTTQIFFDEASNETVLAMSPYNERPNRDTTNETDDIFLPDLIASLSGDPNNGLTAEFAICLEGLPEPGRRDGRARLGRIPRRASRAGDRSRSVGARDRRS